MMNCQDFIGFYRPVRAKLISEGRSPSKVCGKNKPCKGVRIMRVALSGLNILSVGKRRASPYANEGCPFRAENPVDFNLPFIHFLRNP